MSEGNYDVQSIAFGSGGVEISYLEPRESDTKTGISEYRTLVIPMGLVENELEELLDAASQLLDAAGVARRDPPQTLRPTR